MSKFIYHVPPAQLDCWSYPRHCKPPITALYWKEIRPIDRLFSQYALLPHDYVFMSVFFVIGACRSPHSSTSCICHSLISTVLFDQRASMRCSPCSMPATTYASRCTPQKRSMSICSVCPPTGPSPRSGCANKAQDRYIAWQCLCSAYLKWYVLTWRYMQFWVNVKLP